MILLLLVPTLPALVEDLLRTGSEKYELCGYVFNTVSDLVSDKLTYPTGYFEQLENYSHPDEIAQNFDICISQNVTALILII